MANYRYKKDDAYYSLDINYEDGFIGSSPVFECADFFGYVRKSTDIETISGAEETLYYKKDGDNVLPVLAIPNRAILISFIEHLEKVEFFTDSERTQSIGSLDNYEHSVLLSFFNGGSLYSEGVTQKGISAGRRKIYLRYYAQDEYCFNGDNSITTLDIEVDLINKQFTDVYAQLNPDCIWVGVPDVSYTLTRKMYSVTLINSTGYTAYFTLKGYNNLKVEPLSSLVMDSKYPKGENFFTVTVNMYKESEYQSYVSIEPGTVQGDTNITVSQEIANTQHKVIEGELRPTMYATSEDGSPNMGVSAVQKRLYSGWGYSVSPSLSIVQVIERNASMISLSILPKPPEAMPEATFWYRYVQFNLSASVV